MNIKQAKQQIKNAMTAYFTKNEFGRYVIPINRQRPIFLMGPPGIGKTAIMEQIARELGVGIVSYSMTHHTRQSALGLPYITTKEYGGRSCQVSEYTMSEIIASVYEKMELSGKKEGILFLDEINCVSETLAPAMLQFLQYKVFGRHTVPDGWIVVTAGNPPEFNNSVREFDIVTWDRLKRIDVEPDYDVWKEYAADSGIHPSITTYLDLRKDDFYKIETTPDGKSFVTARGWCDLSDMIRLYERNGLEVDELLISQYIQNRRIAKAFSGYYGMFSRYRTDYKIDTILNGTASDETKRRAFSAAFDERISLIGLITDTTLSVLKSVWTTESFLDQLETSRKAINSSLSHPKANADTAIDEELSFLKRALQSGLEAGLMSDNDSYILSRTIAAVEEMKKASFGMSPEEAKKEIDLVFDGKVSQKDKEAEKAGMTLSNVFRFLDDVFADGQEMLIFVTELTASRYGAQFISRHGCEEYFRHNDDLLLFERKNEIEESLRNI